MTLRSQTLRVRPGSVRATVVSVHSEASGAMAVVDMLELLQRNIRMCIYFVIEI